MKNIVSRRVRESLCSCRGNFPAGESPRSAMATGRHGLLCLVMALLLATVSSQAANIYFVSFHSADDSPSTDATNAGFTEAPDIGYTRLLEAAGHTVTRYVTTGTPDTAVLNAADLVIISRSVPSGDYQQAAETAAWNGITAPTMILGGYLLRNTRLGLTTGGTMIDTAGTISLAVSDPAHPIFNGVSLDAGNVLMNSYANIVEFTGSPQRGISVNSSPVAGGTVLATVATAGDPAVDGMIIGEWEAGTVMANGGNDTLGGDRLVFLTGSREDENLTSHGAGIYDLTSDGAQMFLNAVGYMTGEGPTALPLVISVVETNGDTDAPGAKYSGQTFDHPNLGAGFTVPEFGDEVPAFTDRVHEWTAPTGTLGMPPYLEGGTYIMSQNDNRENADLTIDITLGQRALVYILVDNRYPDGENATPPAFGGATQWILDGGWEPVTTGHNRTGDISLPDEVGMDEGADGDGSGQGVNQWSSIYVREVGPGTVTLMAADNAGRNMYGAVVMAADPSAFPPQISNIVPANGTTAYDPAGGLSFSATTDEANQIDAARITVILNEVDVSSQLQVSGTETARDVLFDALLPNTQYVAEISVKDQSGRETSRTFSFDTFGDTSMTIEAENWNFDGGMFIDDPVLSFSDPNSYVDKGAQFGIGGIDYVENTPETRPDKAGGEFEWRIPFTADLPQTESSSDTVRQQYMDAAFPEYDLTMTQPGEWLNYTRTFAAGNYHVAGRFQANGPFTARLDVVTSDPTAANQTTEIAGFFLGSNTGSSYELVAATDANGRAVTVALDGESTLRLTVLEGTFNANYLVLGPVSVSAGLPSVTLTSPTDGQGIVPGTDLDLTVDVSDSDGSIVSVEFLATADDGSVTPVGTATTAPFTVTWPAVPEGSYSIVARATDDTGLVAESAAAEIFVDDTPPTLVEAKGKPTLDTVIVTYSEAIDADSATDLANYDVTSESGSLNLIDAVLSSDGTGVTITTGTQEVGDEYTVTVNDVTDLAGNPVAANSQATFTAIGPLLQTDAGFVIWEAEDFDRNLDGRWLIDTERGTPSGGASVVNPNGFGGNANDTVLEYDIMFVQTGTHIIWYRASGDSGSDDSAWLRLDGAPPAGRENSNDAAMTGFSNESDFVWESDSFTGSDPMTFEITEAGLHTIGLARREDGSFFDKFIITTDPGFVPTGEGPVVTPRLGEPPPPAADITITLHPADMAVEENLPVTFTADAESDDPLLAFQWQQEVGGIFEDIPSANGTSYTIDAATLDMDGIVLRARVTVTGNEAFTDTATLTVNADTAPPEVVRAYGDEVRSRVVLVFTESLDPTTASDASNYTISGPEGAVGVFSADYTPTARTVILGTGAQTVGNKYTITVSGVNDLAATPNPASGEAKFYSLGARLPQGADGLVAYEAENYEALFGALWEQNTLSGTPSGGISMHMPQGATDDEFADQLEYHIDFTQAGTHYIWWRGRADGGGDDSGWLHVNGQRPPERESGNSASMSGINTGPGADFVWSNDSQDGPDPMTFDIVFSGLNIIGLGSREDGAYFDKFVITTDPDFNPSAAYGPFGPPETRQGQPPLPTIEITSPADLAEFGQGADVDFTVDIGETTRVIEVVEYFADGIKIGESTESPYSFTWEDLPIGAHTVTARLTDDVGDSIQSATVTVISAGANDVLFLVGNPDLTGATSDSMIFDRLTAFGFNVVVVDDGASTSTDAIGKRLIVNSSTVNSGNVGTKFRDAEVPVVTWEQANQDDFGMTLDTDGTDRGTLTGQTELEVVDATHPMAAGLPLGALTVMTSATDYSWGLPNENAATIATVVGNPNQVLIYGYDTGATMTDGLVAPARRVHLFLTDNAFELLNADGIALFDAALSWAVDEELAVPTGLMITGVTAGPEGLTLTWEGGTGPFTIQTKATLNDPWSDLLTTDETTETVAVDGASGFFRISAP